MSTTGCESPIFLDNLHHPFGRDGKAAGSSGPGGDLAGILTFEPGYLNLDSRESFQEYLLGFAPSRTAVIDVGNTHVRNFDRYQQSLWPAESLKMEAVATGLNRHFVSLDVIGRWEEVTGCTFKYDTYVPTGYAVASARPFP